MITIILTMLLYLGAGALAGMLLYFAVVTLGKILERIREFLSEHVGGTYVCYRMEKVIDELRIKAQQEGNVTRLDDLLKELEENNVNEDSIVEGKVDKKGKVVGLKILTGEDGLDKDLSRALEKRNGEIIIQN